MCVGGGWRAVLRSDEKLLRNLPISNNTSQLGIKMFRITGDLEGFKMPSSRGI